MSGDPIQNKALKMIREMSQKFGSSTNYTELVTDLSVFADEDMVIKALKKMRQLGRIVITESQPDVWMVRAAETNPDGSAERCRYCDEPRESFEAWDAAAACSGRPDPKPCVPRWTDYRGRDKILQLDHYPVNRVLRTIEDARTAAVGHSVWAPLAIAPTLFAPISKGALFALVRHYRHDDRYVGVHISDQLLPFDTAQGIVVVVDLVKLDPPDAAPH